MPAVIIYGPPACGKTQNSQALAKLYNCTKVIDEPWDPQDGVYEDWTLYLCQNWKTIYILPRGANPTVLVVSYTEAIAKLQSYPL